MNLKFRDAEHAHKDINYVTSTWLDSLWHSKEYKNMKKSIFYESHNKAILRRMQHLNCIIACNPDDPYVIFGYIVYSRPDVIQFGYVKGGFRGFGIFKALIKEAFGAKVSPKYVTHITEHAREMIKKHDIQYDPYRFFEVGSV